MESTPQAEQTPIIEVKRLHFLIHPGFLRDPASDDLDVRKSETDERYTQWNSLLNSYIGKARELPKDEVMIVMLHAGFDDLFRDFKQKKEYTQTLSSLKSILGKRMIALSNDHYIEDQESYRYAQAIAENRGFHFLRDVYSEAYGESLGACVEDAAQAANQSLGLTHKTILRPELTDNPNITTHEKQSTLDLYDRVQFALNA